MNRFLVFQYYDYYPAGGMNDLKRSCVSFREAVKFIKDHHDGHDTNEIFDLEKNKGVLVIKDFAKNSFYLSRPYNYYSREKDVDVRDFIGMPKKIL